MSIEIKATSTLTDRYQTTIPKVIRDFLGLQKGEKFKWVITDEGVYIMRSDGRPDCPPPPPVKPHG